MKKFYSILAAAAALTLTATALPGSESVPRKVPAEAKTVPYSSNIALSSSTLDPDWTVINANNDSETWTAYSHSQTSWGGPGFAARYKYHSTNPGDDYLISPAITLQAGTEYMVRYQLSTYSYPESMKVYVSTTTEPEEIQALTPMKEHIDLKQNFYTLESFCFTPETDGEYYVSFYECSSKNQFYLYLAGFEIMENKFAPSTVTGLSAVRDAARDVKVGLSWTLPTKSTLGVAFSEEQTVEKVLVYRDGGERAIVELEGAVTEFTDTEEYGLTPGNHTYEVAVLVAGEASAKCTPITVKNVGPLVPVDVPADLTINDADDYDNWTVLVGDGRVGNCYDWAMMSAGNGAQYRYVASTDQDDWLISPPVNISAPGYYKIDLGIYKSSPYDIVNKFELYTGKELSIEGMTQLVTEQIPLSTTKKTQTLVAKIAEAGTHYFAVHAATKSATGSMYVYVTGMTIEQTEKTPLAVTDLTATPDADLGLSVTLNWTAPTEDTTGGELLDEEYGIEVYRGEDLIATLAGVSEYFDAEVPAPGVYTYTVKTVAPEGASVESHPSVTTTWVGKPLVALPYSTVFKTSDVTRVIWSVIDANKDGKTWALTSGTLSDDDYGCNPPVADSENVRHYLDYLISPYMDFEPGYYAVSFKIRATKDMPLNVGLIPAGTASEERMDLQQVSHFVSAGTSWNQATAIFHFDEAGEYQIVFAMNEDTTIGTYYDSDKMRIDDVSVDVYPVLPDVVTDLKVVAAENEVLEATVSWVNPTGSNVPGLTPELTMAYIYRDGELAGIVDEGLVAGEPSEWVDNAENGLSAGSHIYEVEVYTADGKSTATRPAVTSEWIGGGYEAPYEVSGTNYDGPYYFTEWTIINVDGDKTGTSVWAEERSWIARGAALNAANVESKADDWAISPRIQLDHNMVYKLTVDTYLGSSYEKYDVDGEGYPVEVYAGRGSDYTQFTYIATLHLSARDAANSLYLASSPQTHELYVCGATDEEMAETPEPDEPETQSDEDDMGISPNKDKAVKVPMGGTSFAFYVNTPGGCNIRRFVVEKDGSMVGVDFAETAAGDVVFADGRLVIDGTATDLRIYDVTGKLVAMADEVGEGGFSLEGLNAGVYIVRLSVNGTPVTLKVKV